MALFARVSKFSQAANPSVVRLIEPGVGAGVGVGVGVGVGEGIGVGVGVGVGTAGSSKYATTGS